MGSKAVEVWARLRQRLGKTPPSEIPAMSERERYDLVFEANPYLKNRHPDFAALHSWYDNTFLAQRLTASELSDKLQAVRGMGQHLANIGVQYLLQRRGGLPNAEAEAKVDRNDGWLALTTGEVRVTKEMPNHETINAFLSEQLAESARKTGVQLYPNKLRRWALMQHIREHVYGNNLQRTALELHQRAHDLNRLYDHLFGTRLERWVQIDGKYTRTGIIDLRAHPRELQPEFVDRDKYFSAQGTLPKERHYPARPPVLAEQPNLL
jgi:hypothetical protein